MLISTHKDDEEEEEFDYENANCESSFNTYKQYN